MPPTKRADRLAEHWRRLGLIPGAPECVIKAAHRAQIELHHPDRGGDAEAAKQINVAYDELKGEGAPANEYVAANYNAEPWAVLGITAAADAGFVSRAGRSLASELGAHPRLAERVDWAVKNFSSAKATANNGRARVSPLTPPPPRRTTPERSAHRPPPEPAKPGVPEGLPAKLDFGRVDWRADATRTIQLTWKRHAPYGVTVETSPPLVAEVTASKVLAGRFSIAFSIDWSSDELSGGPTVRGYTLDAPVTLRWAGGGEYPFRAKGLLLYPALVSASPTALDLGTVDAKSGARASMVLVSSGVTQVDIEPPAWLRRTDGSGRALDAPLKLSTNVPVRVEFRVDWAPILERAQTSFAAGRPVRPTGTIVVRWESRSIDVPVQMIVPAPRGRG